ncbi:MAG: hypothetical protein M1826_003651 [Phylliscum demangeonii]|nr:MAG: hypothetical protein M1826_003651 [Phylliscum demangeonii]
MEIRVRLSGPCASIGQPILIPVSSIVSGAAVMLIALMSTVVFCFTRRRAVRAVKAMQLDALSDATRQDRNELFTVQALEASHRADAARNSIERPAASARSPSLRDEMSINSPTWGLRALTSTPGAATLPAYSSVPPPYPPSYAVAQHDRAYTIAVGRWPTHALPPPSSSARGSLSKPHPPLPHDRRAVAFELPASISYPAPAAGRRPPSPLHSPTGPHYATPHYRPYSPFTDSRPGSAQSLQRYGAASPLLAPPATFGTRDRPATPLSPIPLPAAVASAPRWSPDPSFPMAQSPGLDWSGSAPAPMAAPFDLQPLSPPLLARPEYAHVGLPTSMRPGSPISPRTGRHPLSHAAPPYLHHVDARAAVSVSDGRPWQDPWLGRSPLSANGPQHPQTPDDGQTPFSPAIAPREWYGHGHVPGHNSSPSRIDAAHTPTEAIPVMLRPGFP